MKTAEELFEEGSMLIRDYKGHEQMLMNEGTFIDIMEAYANQFKPDKICWQDAIKNLPNPLQTVWLTNGKEWVALGCLVETNEGWHWAESNGTMYIENGEIVAECESEDLDVVYWHALPKPLPINSIAQPNVVKP